jgi:hypothetical protein
MKKWRAMIRVCDGKIGKELDGDGEHIVDFTHRNIESFNAPSDGQISSFGGCWYKVEVTSDELGVDDDGNPI